MVIYRLKIDKQFSKGEKEISIYNPISSDLDVLRRSIFSNLAIHLKKNQDRGYEDLSLFEIGPHFLEKSWRTTNSSWRYKIRKSK